MRTFKLVVAYDGTDYKGWQIQNNDPTIQGKIEEKLGIILNQPIRITGSGRTDAGVHALNQVAHFCTRSKLDLSALQKGLNSLLPPDIVVKDVADADDDFHARYSAKSRVYKYLIWNGEIRSPFYRRFSWHVRNQLDRERMREAAQCLIGWHDFASFQGTGSICRTSEREVIKFTLTGRSSRWVVVTIEASAFLRHMVRNIVGTLIEVGKGCMSVSEFKAILDAQDRGEAGITAPPQGLFLKEVKY
jgi:tRNA pseudouridine38-40 synthase